MRKWWQEPSYPPSVWTAADRAAARKDGWKPPPGERFEETREHLAAQASLSVVPPEPIAGPPGGLYSDAQGDVDRRRRAADRVLEKAGLKRRPW